MSVSVMLIVAPFTGPLSPSNQIAPTPNCQLKSLLPVRIRVLRAAVMVPATAVPSAGVDARVAVGDVQAAAVGDRCRP